MATVTNTHKSNAIRTPELRSNLDRFAISLLWLRRFRARRQLIDLQGQSDHILKDVGLQRSDIQRETLKWFWMP
jgi:uncharacterized protein YjiS (DUF1127 family)